MRNSWTIIDEVTPFPPDFWERMEARKSLMRALNLKNTVAALRMRVVGLLLFGADTYRSFFTDPLEYMSTQDRKALWGDKDAFETTRQIAHILHAEVGTLLTNLVGGGELYIIPDVHQDEENVCGAFYEACKLPLSDEAMLAMDEVCYTISMENSSSYVGELMGRMQRVKRILRHVQRWNPMDDLPEEVFEGSMVGIT